MKAQKIITTFALTFLLTAVLVRIGTPANNRAEQQGLILTETLQVMGKGTDYVVVGEEQLYVVPNVTKIMTRYGATIDLSKLHTPCLAEVTYVPWIKGVDKSKSPVVLELKVKKVAQGATMTVTQE